MVSYAAELAGLILLVHFAVFTPKIIAHHYQAIELYAPTESKPLPPPPKIARLFAPPKVVIQRMTPPKIELPQADMTPPKVEIAKVEPPPLPPAPKPEPPKVETGKFDSAPVPPAPRGNPTKTIETGAFSGSSAPATVKAPVQTVQTGGFGDPNGLPGKGTKDHPALTAAALGSFDLPSGPGQGNGTGGGKGIRGTVASAGFGNGTAGPGSGDHGGTPGGGVRTAGFGDSQPAVREVKAKVTPSAPAVVPVEILEKPTPAYTQEARQLKIQGEVLLKVVFLSNGKIEVVGVVRGLGHGLDEAAINAAQRIKFKPAQREGQAVDYPATIHIVFQMA